MSNQPIRFAGTMKRQRHVPVGYVMFLVVVVMTAWFDSTSTADAWTIPLSSSTSLARRNTNVLSGRNLLLPRFASSSGNDKEAPVIGTETQQPSQPQHHVTIEYCTGCRWMMRSAWMAQELLTTFQDELHGVTLIPSRPPNSGGVFSVHAVALGNATPLLLWDRKEQGGFPELKQLKQLLRDVVAPEQFLGHSDTTDRKQPTTTTEATTAASDCVECQTTDAATTKESVVLPITIDNTTSTTGITSTSDKPLVGPLPNVAITYCTGCRWLLRAGWIGQELLTTFDTQINSLTLIPSKPPQKGGTFTVTLNGDMVWDRSEQGRFPEAKELKQLIRDRIAPEKDLGHSDDKESQQESVLVVNDEEEAAKLRNFFGVQ